MKTKSGVFSFEGRIGRGKYWAQLVLFMALIFSTLIQLVGYIADNIAALAGGKVASL